MMNTNFTGRSIASDGTAWCTYSNVLAKNVIVCGVDKLFQGTQKIKTLTLWFQKKHQVNLEILKVKLGFNPPETRVYLIEMHG